jgi:hypothetical protein
MDCKFRDSFISIIETISLLGTYFVQSTQVLYSLTCISNDLTEDNTIVGLAFILYFVNERDWVTGHSSRSVQ